MFGQEELRRRQQERRAYENQASTFVVYSRRGGREEQTSTSSSFRGRNADGNRIRKLQLSLLQHATSIFPIILLLA